MRKLAVLAVSVTLAVGGAVVGAPPAAAQTVVYSNDFSGSIGIEWSPNAAIVDTPSGERVLGSRVPFGSPTPVSGTQTLTLTLTGLPAHSQMALTVDLYTLRSWDGNRTVWGGVVMPQWGPDFWDLDATGTAPDIQPRTTFSNYVEVEQSYPDAFPGSNPGTTGAAAAGDLLGFGTSGNSEIAAVRYALSYSFVHTDGSVTFSFAGENLQFWGDEGWVLDNVVVSVTPACPAGNGDDDLDDDGLDDEGEDLFGGLLGDSDSDDDGVLDGNEDSDGDGDEDEDEDDETDRCPTDSDGDGEDDEDEDDD
jgi:hypothetical protein